MEENSVDKYYDWESVYEALKTQSYKDVLDEEFETGRRYELPFMITYFKEKNDTSAVDFLISLEETIEEEEGRKVTIGDKFILDDENVKCTVEVIDFDENMSAFIEFSDIHYKTSKHEITSNLNVNDLKRLR